MAALPVGAHVEQETVLDASGTRARLEGKTADLPDGTLVLKAELTALYFA